MSRTLKITALVVAIGLVPLLVVGVLKQRESDRAAVDNALVSRADVQATELEAGFARGRTIALLMAGNPSFGDFYAEPGTRAEKVAAQGSTIDRVHTALSYLETLYPEQIGEVCFIDRSGVENARVVGGTGRSRRSSRTNPGMRSSSPRSHSAWVGSTSRGRMSRRIRASG